MSDQPAPARPAQTEIDYLRGEIRDSLVHLDLTVGRLVDLIGHGERVLKDTRPKPNLDGRAAPGAGVRVNG